jgi:O-antigen/teichoic acid export membrane protein
MSHSGPSESSPFVKDVIKLVTGTTIAQIITILASPIITRLYGPEAFGTLALFVSITGIIGVIACMRYELTIMLPTNDDDAINLLGLSLLMVVIITLLTGIGLFFVGDALLALLRAPGLVYYLWLIPPFILSGGIFLALNYWNSRTRHFGRLSVARVTSAAVTTGTQLGAGFSGYATGGSLIGASLVGSAVSTAVLSGKIWRDDWDIFKRGISWHRMMTGLKRYKKFPLIDSGSALLNTISWQLPVLLLSMFFSPVIVGFYALGMLVLQAPMNLIGGSIAQVFFQRAANAKHNGNLSMLVENIFWILLKISMFPLLLLVIVGKDIFLVVFGQAWGEAGLYAQILGIWAIFWFISSPLSTILSVHERLGLGFNLTILNLSTRLLSLLIGGLIGSVLVALSLFSASGALIYGLACFIFLKLAGLSYANTAKMILKCFLVSLVFLIPIIIIKYSFQSTLVVVISAAIIFFGYYFYIYQKDPQFYLLVREIKF